MKALVLAGGAGTRLRPITHTSAKQLLPVANKPVLFYGLEAIRDAGITDVGLVVGDTAEAIKAALGDGSAFGLRTTYIRQGAPLGLAHAVLIAARFPRRGRFRHVPRRQLHRRWHHPAGAGVPIGASGRPDPARRRCPTHVVRCCGTDATGQVVGLEEKPKQPKSNLALVGVYIFSPAVHEAVRNLEPSWRGELEITEAIQWLIEHGNTVRSSVISGYWKDTGNVTDMLEVNRLVLETAEPRQDGTWTRGPRSSGGW